MGHIAGMDAEEAVLPEPQQVLLNARFAAIQAAHEKALRPLAIAENIVRITVIFALAGSVFGLWFGLRSLAANLPAANLHVPQTVLNSAAALVTCLITLVCTKIVQPILMEE
ncbi:MAG TPA: hypothetical protein VMG30_04805 [Acidobacteriota bacterium]|nr:hypothetical protein [Acidobacteriota bacterium]